MKTAVLVRGHARTWSLTRENTIALMTDVYGDVDWFFAAPATTTVSTESLTNDFAGLNLRKVILTDESRYPLAIKHEDVEKWRFWIPAYWRLAWLDYQVGIAKRQFELDNGMRYDNVLFIRPDCWYFRVGQPERATKPLHSMSVSHIGQNGAMSVDDWVSDDLIWRAGANAADIICMRWLDTHTNRHDEKQLVHGNSQALLAAYIVRNFIGHDPDTNAFTSTLIRPDHADHMPWTWEKHDVTHTDSYTWHGLATDEKINWCQKLGIDPRDYQLQT